MSDVRNLVERLRQIAESQRMDLDSPNVAATLDDAATTLEALAAIGSVVAEEPEWEYGFTSKWGTIAARSEPDAERRAQDQILSIEQGRESGDLEYHGRVMKRSPESKPGPWVPVKREGAETDA